MSKQTRPFLTALFLERAAKSVFFDWSPSFRRLFIIGWWRKSLLYYLSVAPVFFIRNIVVASRMEEESRIKSEPPESPKAPSASYGRSPYLIEDILSGHRGASSGGSSSMSMLGSASLFQPFLHHLAVVAGARALPFSIDNILNPNFGGSPPSGTTAAVPHHHSSPPSPATTTSTTSAVKNEQHQMRPVDLSPSQEPPSPPPTSPGSPKKDDADVPPGMVRGPNGQLWPAWVFCTRYSDRPSSGPRLRKMKKSEGPSLPRAPRASAEKRPRTAFSSDQLARLKREFEENRYLTEERRRSLSSELGLDETQIKIWFQNKRAKIKKSTGQKGELAQMLAAQGLYNHSTVPIDEEESILFE